MSHFNSPLSTPKVPPESCLSLLQSRFPHAEIRSVLEYTGKVEKRARLLPAALVVQLILCLCIVRDAASRSVLGYLLAGKLPSKMAISNARYRLGPRPIIELFRRCCASQADPDAIPEAFYGGLRLVAIDGTQIDIPDTPANERIFGRVKVGRGKKAAFPSARVITMSECATHATLDALVRPIRRRECSGAYALIRRSVTRGMLVLLDRGLCNSKSVQDIEEKGAHVLGRVTRTYKLPADKILPDGTWLTKVGNTEVRVICYQIPSSKEKQDSRITLITTLRDWKKHPARELAALYHERWEIETAFDEMKVHQLGRPNGQATEVRAQLPAGVVQEIYAMLLAHGMLRSLMSAAAVQEGVDPDRVSFKNTLVIVRRKLEKIAEADPEDLPPLLPN